MKVLLVKTSSLGDVIHALPAVTEAVSRIEEIEFTWVVEEGLADIPLMHPGVSRVIPVSIRRWRRNWWQSRAEIRRFVAELRDTTYDMVLDSQGLLKSAVLTSMSRGDSYGYDNSSARESLAASFYAERFDIPTDRHAVQRQKLLFARAFRYETGESVDYGLKSLPEPKQQVVFLHGTTWPSKEWPLVNWQALAKLVTAAGYEVVVPAGSDTEKETASRILESVGGRALDRLPLPELAEEIASSAGVVSVDTGLGHLAAAFDVPMIGLYGATDPALTSMIGDTVQVIVSNHLPCIPCRKRNCQFPNPPDSSSIYPPCFERTTPESVWQALRLRIGSAGTTPG